MKVNFDFFKKYSSTPVMSGCLACKKVKSAFTLKKDIFISNKEQKKSYYVNLFNPYTRIYNYSTLNLDLSRPCTIRLAETKANPLRNKPLILKFHPDNIGTVYKKVKDRKTGTIKKKPLKVRILTSSDNVWTTTYHFLSKDLKKEIGYVSIGDYKLLKENDKNEFLRLKFYDRFLLKNHEKQGITGDRIKILYLQNSDDSVYSGVGRLADRLAVEYCLKQGLPLNIVSDADIGSYIAHYKRGKRYFVPEKDSYSREFFIEKYGENNPNKIIEQLLSNHTGSGEKIDLHNWGALPMYLPHKIAEKYAEMSKFSPLTFS